LNDGACSRGARSLRDINNDGNIDIVIFNVEPPSLLNDTKNSNIASFQLIGTKSNRRLGARITVTSATRSQIEEVKRLHYLSTNDPRLLSIAAIPRWTKWKSLPMAARDLRNFRRPITRCRKAGVKSTIKPCRNSPLNNCALG